MKGKTKIGVKMAVLLLLFFALCHLCSFAGPNTAKLEAVLQSIIEQRTVTTDAYDVINLGNFFFAKELYPLAQEEYEKALQLEPANKIALINLSYLFYKMGDFEQTLVQLERLAEDDITYAYYLRGMIYKEQRELEKAIEQYEKLIKLIPNHPQFLADLGQLYLDSQQLVKANEKFMEMSYLKYRAPIMEKLLAYQPNAYCYLNLGNYYRSNGEPDPAKEAYQAATKFEGDDRTTALAYYYLGEIDLKDYNFDRATLEKELSQKVYPLGGHQFTFNNFAEALIEIGDQYYHNGKLPGALEHFQLAANLASAPDILADAHYKKGLTYYRSQDYKNALREAETALSINPEYLSDRQRLIALLIANSWAKLTNK